MRLNPDVRHQGFTILELMTSLMVVAILTGILIVSISGLRARAQRVQCTANLKSLTVAANLYVQENGRWPQIPPTTAGMPTEPFAEAWITALAPFGADRKTWICPAIQRSLKDPDYSTAQTARIDYFPMAFDDKQVTPHRWPRQPWFIESGDMHGSGNLIIFTDGSVSDVKSVLESARAK